MTAAIEARDVTRRFGAVTAVDEVTLTVGPGEVVGMIGANGAGKTTLIRMLLGLLAPTAGEVRLLDEPPHRSVRRRVGYVPQGLGLWPDLTVSEHLSLVRAAYGVTPPPLEDDELRGAADRVVATLPLGLRRGAAFTLALAHRPEALLLDEPTSGVDPLARSRLWDTIRGAAAAGAGVLVSTHYLEEAGQCDRVVLLSSGRVAAAGTVAELTRGRTAVEVRTRWWQEAWTRLEQAGLPVLPAGRTLRVSGVAAAEVAAALSELDADVTTAPATLDEIFLVVTA